MYNFFEKSGDLTCDLWDILSVDKGGWKILLTNMVGKFSRQCREFSSSKVVRSAPRCTSHSEVGAGLKPGEREVQPLSSDWKGREKPKGEFKLGVTHCSCWWRSQTHDKQSSLLQKVVRYGITLKDQLSLQAIWADFKAILKSFDCLCASNQSDLCEKCLSPHFPIRFGLNSGNLILCPNFPEDHRVWLIQYFSFIVLTMPIWLNWSDWKYEITRPTWEPLERKVDIWKYESWTSTESKCWREVRYVLSNGPILAHPC